MNDESAWAEAVEKTEEDGGGARHAWGREINGWVKEPDTKTAARIACSF